MLHSTTPNDLRRRRLIVIGAAITLLLIASVTYAVLVSRSHSSDGGRSGNTTEAGAAASTETGVETETSVTDLQALRSIRDPKVFAHEIAEALFAWDTATLISRTDHVEQLVAVADPTGESAPGLVADLDNYLPTQDAWTQLAQYETRQWLSVDSAATPSKWAEAKVQGGDELLPGTTAYTIHGKRHRSGVWEGEPVTSEDDVAFTIFLVCGPSYPECRLLRLSQLDKPLD